MEKCGDHSGCMERIKTLEKSDEDQWTKINSIKDRSNQIYGAVMVSMLGVIGMLIIEFVKMAGSGKVAP